MRKSNMENSANSNQLIENQNIMQKISPCGVISDNTSEIIQKLESEMPLFFQDYSDLYSKYLHSIKDIFGVCHLAEKQYFDKLDVNQDVLKQFNDYFKSITNTSKSQIDLSRDFLKYYFYFQLSLVDSSDKYTHTLMNGYAKMLSKFIK